MRSLLALVVAVSMLGCAVEGAGVGADGDPAPPGYQAESVTVCGARLERYPVRGAHNGGWDDNVSTFTCSPKPSWAPNNSDFYRGAGDVNHANGHLGNDIFAARGAPIVVARTGVVTRVANDAIGGLNLSMRDDCGWYLYYAHLDSIDAAVVQTGKRLAAGTRIGTLGDTGQARGTMPHLHFSIFPGDYDRGIDPFPFLKAVEATACAASSSPCPHGDGLYCGGNGVSGDALSLYQCSGGVASSVRSCALGCARMPAGTNDACATGVACPHGDGAYCGGSGIGGDPRVLYRCSAGRITPIRTCASSCRVQPPGTDDTCA